jgi:ParB family transcriptional regulator, chromosome partitioning protein
MPAQSRSETQNAEDRSRVRSRPASVPTDSLRPNPHNPRMLFDELPLKTLEDSIRKVGILVPLTVYRARGSDKYTILDGQRRWICAQRVHLAKVPINEVAEPSVAENIVTMFQIHKLRKDWELMPTALKLGVLMDELKEKRDRQLAELTGLDVAVVSRCKKLLTYPRRYQQMMLFSDPKDRVKADFFIELYPVLHDRLVRSASWFNQNHMIDRFLYKYQHKLSGFKAITDFRKIKQYLAAARAADQQKTILAHLRVFIDDDKKDLSYLEIDAARIRREASSIVRHVERLTETLKNLDVQEFLGEEELWTHLETLLVSLRKKLTAADRRLP